MCRFRISTTLVDETRELMKGYSNSEIAEKLKVSVTTVKRIIRENGLTRTREETETIRSRTRKDLIRAERRRAIFGLDQKTGIKVFRNRERSNLKYCLKRRKYFFIMRGDNTAYFDDNTERNPKYEERGRKLGLKFMTLKTQTQ